jgi:hypothetical protein
MYCDLRERFWWKDMKSDIAAYVARCDICQRVKAEHKRPPGLLQPLDIPVWKWEDIGMDFIVGLPRSQKGHDSIWVIVDHLTKVAHFILVKIAYTEISLQTCILTTSYLCMELPRPLCQIEGLYS